jgi:hypothetical protein
LEFGDLPLLEGPHITKVVDPHISWAPSPNPKKSLKEVVPYPTLPNFVEFEGPYKSGRYPSFFLSFSLSFFFGYVGPSTFVIKVPQIPSEWGECLGGMGV